jgi:hypothetical protein
MLVGLRLVCALGSGTCCILLEAGSLGFIMVIQSLPIGVCGVSVCFCGLEFYVCNV